MFTSRALTVKMNVEMSLFDCDFMLQIFGSKIENVRLYQGLFKCHSEFFSDTLGFAKENETTQGPHEDQWSFSCLSYLSHRTVWMDRDTGVFSNNKCSNKTVMFKLLDYNTNEHDEYYAVLEQTILKQHKVHCFNRWKCVFIFA